MSTQHSKQAFRPSPKDAKGPITCIICGAVYAPSQDHENLLQAPPVALESAFMSMCHFCFRCRRPACPECWDDIHGVCGMCGHETGLPLGMEATLWGEALATTSHILLPAHSSPAAVPFVCIRAGCLHTILTSHVNECSSELTPSAGFRERTSRLFIEVTPPVASGVPISASPVYAGGDEIETQPEVRSRVRSHVERIITMFVATVLFFLILLIILAVSSEYVNTLIATTIHIDIREEIAYLWQLIRGIH